MFKYVYEQASLIHIEKMTDNEDLPRRPDSRFLRALSHILPIFQRIAYVYIGILVGVFLSHYAIESRGNWFHKTYISLTSLPEYLRDLQHYYTSKPARFLHPRPDGATVIEDGNGSQGKRLFLVGMAKSRGFTIQIIDAKGNTRHDWNIIWADLMGHRGDAELVQRAVWAFEAMLLEDNDIIVNVSAGPIARIGPCGKVRWKTLFNSHHSFSNPQNEHILVPEFRDRETDAHDFDLPINAPFTHSGIAAVDLKGNVLWSRPLITPLIESGFASTIVTSSYLDRRNGEVMHINSVAELGASKASAFPQFEQGDLLISDKLSNSIFVTDGELERVKWLVSDLTYEQHDAQFLDNGLIGIFDNGFVTAGSRVAMIDPQSRRIVSTWPIPTETRIYTPTKGAYEFLENGNLLVVEADRGRIFEIDPTGKVVWQFENRFDETDNALVTFAKPVEPGQLESLKAACP